jgi:hypothetical protein
VVAFDDAGNVSDPASTTEKVYCIE